MNMIKAFYTNCYVPCQVESTHATYNFFFCLQSMYRIHKAKLCETNNKKKFPQSESSALRLLQNMMCVLQVYGIDLNESLEYEKSGTRSLIQSNSTDERFYYTSLQCISMSTARLPAYTNGVHVHCTFISILNMYDWYIVHN